MITRYYLNKINKYLKPNKVLVIYGPRQVGKTTLVEEFLKSFSGKVYKSTGENAELRQILESNSFSKIIPFFRDYDLVFIDEAQKIDNIGQALKILVDQINGIKIIATGSSSFDLSNRVKEPLVGRQTVLTLFPVSALEVVDTYGKMHLLENFENYMVYGGYPEVITEKTFQKKIDLLMQIRDSYLYKDILELEDIKNSRKILDLLRLLAYQIGKEVSLQDIGASLGMSKNTVERYLDLLEKAFVIVNVRGFSRNLRKEIYKTSRYYFYDNGILNALIGNFKPVNMRDDIGMLWENYLFIERMKKREYKRIYANQYFWRTYDKQEIDLIEERDGKLFGYEFKWSLNKKTKAPPAWLKTYQNARFKIIDRDNFFEFIL